MPLHLTADVCRFSSDGCTAQHWGLAAVICAHECHKSNEFSVFKWEHGLCSLLVPFGESVVVKSSFAFYEFGRECQHEMYGKVGDQWKVL